MGILKLKSEFETKKVNFITLWDLEMNGEDDKLMCSLGNYKPIIRFANV